MQKRSLWGAAALVAVGAVGCSGAQPESSGSTSSALAEYAQSGFMLFGGTENLCMGATSLSIGAVIESVACSGAIGGTQSWSIVDGGPWLPGYYGGRITPTWGNTNLCIDVASGEPRLAPCDDGITQYFIFQNGTISTFSEIGDCFNVMSESTKVGAPIQLLPCNGVIGESFFPWGFDLNFVPGVASGEGGACLESPGLGQPIDNVACDASSNEWFTPRLNGTIGTSNADYVTCLTVTGLTGTTGPVAFEPCQDPLPSTQLWHEVYNASGGGPQVESAVTGLSLTRKPTPECLTTAGTMAECLPSGARQMWYFAQPL
jgi:hypothetical protein